jgi:hypothetical protein
MKPLKSRIAEASAAGLTDSHIRQEGVWHAIDVLEACTREEGGESLMEGLHVLKLLIAGYDARAYLGIKSRPRGRLPPVTIPPSHFRAVLLMAACDAAADRCPR